MFPTDPTLYGATLPQRELPLPPVPWSILGQFAHNVPWQQPWQTLPWQNVQWPVLNRFVPPMFQHGMPPYYTPQGYGYPQPFMAPFNPIAFNPYMPTGMPNLPLNIPQGWQKPWC